MREVHRAKLEEGQTLPSSPSGSVASRARSRATPSPATSIRCRTTSASGPTCGASRQPADRAGWIVLSTKIRSTYQVERIFWLFATLNEIRSTYSRVLLSQQERSRVGGADLLVGGAQPLSTLWGSEAASISSRSTTLTRSRPCGSPRARSYASRRYQPSHVV